MEKSKQQHYPEPWVYLPHESKDSRSYIESSDGNMLAEIWSFYKSIDHQANAQRIVACVNAMAGIDDPQKFVDGSRELVKEGVKAKVERDLLKYKIDAAYKLLDELENEYFELSGEDPGETADFMELLWDKLSAIKKSLYNREATENEKEVSNG